MTQYSKAIQIYIEYKQNVPKLLTLVFALIYVLASS